jgi:hypothetical protein
VLLPKKSAPRPRVKPAAEAITRSVELQSDTEISHDCGRDTHYWAPTGSPEAVARLRRRLRNTRFPAARYHLTGADLSPAETRQLRLTHRNRKFDSISIQRGVGCELDFLNHGRRRPFVCNDMAFGIWVGLSPKETRSCGWD